MDSFFDRSGTMRGLMDFASSYTPQQQRGVTNSLGALSKLVSTIMSLFA